MGDATLNDICSFLGLSILSKALSGSLGYKPEKPYMYALDRIANQLESGGPRRARDQEEHCVSRQMSRIQPLEIHPRITDITVGLVKSK